MTVPEHEQARGRLPITPARRARERAGASVPPAGAAVDSADVDRGLAAAVLGALGRMQLRLDAFGRQQTEGLADLRTALAGIEARLAALERAAAVPGAPQRAEQAAPAGPSPYWPSDDVG